jgi:hypothetical protein
MLERAQGHASARVSLEGDCFMDGRLTADPGNDGTCKTGTQETVTSSDVRAEAAPDAAGAGPSQTGPALQPAALLRPKRKVDLSTAVLPGLGTIKAVEALTVRELKGVGASFTPHLELAVVLYGLAYKPPPGFETVYQIVAGPLLADARVLGQARRLAFVPAFSWATLEVVLMPINLSRFGHLVLIDLQRLQPSFPSFKAFVQWSEAKKRHIVYRDELTAQEAGVIEKVRWPTREQVLEALSTSAYDDIDDLAAANEEVGALLRSREVR